MILPSCAYYNSTVRECHIALMMSQCLLRSQLCYHICLREVCYCLSMFSVRLSEFGLEQQAYNTFPVKITTICIDIMKMLVQVYGHHPMKKTVYKWVKLSF